MLNNTPAIKKFLKEHASDNPSFLRKLGDAGVITFSEYLFLLSVITRPQSGHLVAFNIIDVSNENTIHPDEFSQVRKNFCSLT